MQYDQHDGMKLVNHSVHEAESHLLQVIEYLWTFGYALQYSVRVYLAIPCHYTDDYIYGTFITDVLTFIGNDLPPVHLRHLNRSERMVLIDYESY